MVDAKQSVLILDDEAEFGDLVGNLLTAQGYEVSVCSDLSSSLDLLRTEKETTFLVVDRVLAGNALDETDDLRKLCEAAPNTFVIVYTCVSDLTKEETYSIHEQGAVRVISRKTATEFVKNILSLTRELDELLAISSALQEAASERTRMAAALVGTGVSTSVVDAHYQVWFTGPPEREFGYIGNPGRTRLCWQVFHGRPAWVGPCWACPVAEVIQTGSPAQRTLLSCGTEGELIWRSNLSTPICPSDGAAPIAVREGVLNLSEDWLAHLSLPQRLKLIAEGLVFAGFGRARIWLARGVEYAELVAAACCDDKYGGVPVPPDLKDVRLAYKSDPNVEMAIERGIGLAVAEWKTGKESPYKHILEVHPPYVSIPVFGQHDQLEALLCLDFVPLDEELQQKSFSLFSGDEQLKALQETYGDEVLRALHVQADDTHTWNRIVEQAQLRYATAGSVTEAARALTLAFQELLPETVVVVDLRPRDEPAVLRREERLSCGPIPEGLPRVVSKNDPSSLAALAARTGKTYWVNDWSTERQTLLLVNERTLSAGFKSAAAIPLRFELSIHGVLNLYSPEAVRWEQSGYQTPLRSLSRFVALVAEDCLVEQSLVRGALDRAVHARAASEDSVWRHWASRKLFQASLVLARAEKHWSSNSTDPRVPEDLGKATQLLDVIAQARPPEAAEETCDLARLFTTLKREYASEAIYSINLPDEPGLPRVEAPSYFVKHILSVLIDNSLEAMKESGCGATVEVSVEPAGSPSVCLLVHDDGPGIPESREELLFEAPIRSKKPGGRGMGLFIARGAALQYGGDLQLKPSELGASFLLILPSAR